MQYLYKHFADHEALQKGYFQYLSLLRDQIPINDIPDVTGLSRKSLRESEIDRNWVPRPESECPVLQRAHGLPYETCVHRIKIKHLNVDLRKQFCFILAGRGSFLIKILF